MVNAVFTILFGINIPAPAPTMAVPDSICFLKEDRISLRSVGGAISMIDLGEEVEANAGH